ncbi:MAG3720 family protein [Mycoplasmopsis adleri]|uniref:MAG3720 family protein n=1 Tax=Mycoplasmopsis adleri TaxID=51362 RepID=UPI0038730124
MKKYYATFLLNETNISFKMLEETEELYATVWQKQIDLTPNNFKNVETLIEETQNYLYSKLNKKKKDEYRVYYSMIISDMLAKKNRVSLKQNKYEYVLVDNVANDKILKKINSAKPENWNPNDAILKAQTFLYELDNSLGETKRYAEFPKDRNGLELRAYKSYLCCPKDTLVVKILDIFKAKKITFNKILLETQSICAEKNDDKVKLMVNFTWSHLTSIASINNNAYLLNSYLLDEKKFKKGLKDFNDSFAMMQIKISALLKSWKYFSSLQHNTEDAKIFKYMQNVVDNSIQKLYNDNKQLGLDFSNLTVILSGENCDFFTHRWKTLYPNVKIVVIDQSEAKMNNLPLSFLGSTLILSNFELKNHNLGNTIDTVPTNKNKIVSFFKKIFPIKKPNMQNNLS